VSSSGVRRKRGLIIAALVILLLATGVVSLCLGAVKIPLPDVLGALLGNASEMRYESVFWQLRLPRIVLGFLVGGALSVAGVLMQGLFRNPLADPALIGASSGGALGAVFVIVLAHRFFPEVPLLSDLRLLPFAAFAGALLVTGTVQRLANVGGYTAVATLLLVGVAINALASSLFGLATFLSTDAQLRTLSFWTLGSLGAANWQVVGLTLPFCLGLMVLAPIWGGALNAVALGEAEAGHLGFSVEKIKTLLVILTAAGVGASVAFTGIILFVGLVVPHLMRSIIGPDHRWLIPGSALLGAIVLIGSDTIARTILAPAEMPIGVITAGFGTPFFLFMLLRQRRKALWS
jgi:iron complex transport system permease protein